MTALDISAGNRTLTSEMEKRNQQIQNGISNIWKSDGYGGRKKKESETLQVSDLKTGFWWPKMCIKQCCKYILLKNRYDFKCGYQLFSLEERLRPLYSTFFASTSVVKAM